LPRSSGLKPIEYEGPAPMVSGPPGATRSNSPSDVGQLPVNHALVHRMTQDFRVIDSHRWITGRVSPKQRTAELRHACGCAPGNGEWIANLPCENPAPSKHPLATATTKDTHQDCISFKAVGFCCLGLEFARYLQGATPSSWHCCGTSVLFYLASRVHNGGQRPYQRPTMVLTARQRQKLHTAMLG